ncbi:MAG: hypothetical protein OXF73_06135 [Gammaproteobacteria bacterium]|nr:hypothetical protein [Gammaproteobacteria bacterium]MCY4227377.1 hypothetical protein [Gammaproteobacteria bacterium]
MRTAVHADEFNLYYGALRDTNYKWLNPEPPSENILPPPYSISSVAYQYRSGQTDRRGSLSPLCDKAACIKALASWIPELTVMYGHFLRSG